MDRSRYLFLVSSSFLRLKEELWGDQIFVSTGSIYHFFLIEMDELSSRIIKFTTNPNMIMINNDTIIHSLDHP